MKPTRTNKLWNHLRIGARRLPVIMALVGIATLGVLSHAPTGFAAVLQLGEPFNYSDGDLDGRGIDDSFGDVTNWDNNFQYLDAKWASDWAIQEGASLDFKVASGALTLDAAAGIGPDANGNYSATVSRGVSLGPSRKSFTFSGVFTAIGDPGDRYMSTLGFGDAARIGIKNGQFVVELGDQQQVRSGRVQPNTPYTVVAEIEFGVPVDLGDTIQNGERLTVWVNENYRGLNEGTAISQVTLESATGMTSLGDTFSLEAQSTVNSNGDYTITTWDDLFIGSGYQEVNGFRHDISPQGANVQEGYFSWDAAVDGLIKSYTAADTGYDDVTMTIGGTNLVFLDTGNIGTVADDLLRDGAKADGELTLRLEGMDPGELPIGDPYISKSYHDNPDADASPIDIYVDVDGQEELVMTVTPSSDENVATHASIAFSPTGRYANFRFVAQNGGDVWLNGFELVPEPNSSLIMLLGFIGLAARGLRNRGGRR